MIRGDDGNIGFAILAYPCLLIWQRNINGHAVVTWVPWNTLELHNILGVRSFMLDPQRCTECIVGHSEDTNTILIYMDPHVYIVGLRSMKSKRLDDSHYGHSRYHPFMTFYSSGNFSSPVIILLLSCFNTASLEFTNN
jgi:hypothetical protein